ncbi:retrovirus-related Pol polyprotein from type-1 retrotransposable element R2 [Trichonephila clavata]|uniref:Retrovirus-related Pol polyprotein from type-1 retrotransposable element R2 n=1 Tax=Trichonephila clavata TaxID=2740835 RepID=A0A8X6F6K4_TRICU|nr:retrovirus-related Pol polyprotein from type-1 retrotransposable element R2 [Trichonephila clavata]
MRHNAVLARVRTAVAFKGTILHENQVVGPDGLRPDLVALIDNKIFIIDATIPFENRRLAFQQARERKIVKYTPLLSHFASLGFVEAQIVPIVAGSLGAWDPENDKFLRLVATKSYLTTLRKLCVSDSIRWSRDIYIQHLTGAQQYKIGAPTVEDLPATPERRQNIPQSSERNEESPQGDATIASPIEPISPEIEIGANSPPIRRGVNQRRTCTNLNHLSVSSVNITVMYSVFMLCYASGETVFPTYLCFVCLQCHC